MYTYVLMEYTNLRIPQGKVEQMLGCLVPKIEATYEKLPVELPTDSSPKEKLLALLEFAGYDASEDPNGDIIIDDCTREELDSENDPVLAALIGITPEGSHLTLYGDDNSQWQIRYDNTRKWAVRGKVMFPEGGEFFPDEFLPGN